AAIDNVPAWIRRRQLADRLADYYGPGKSLTIWRDDQAEPVPPSAIVAADLTGWRYPPPPGPGPVDPPPRPVPLPPPATPDGRIALGARGTPEGGVWVSYHYAFSDDIGGGGSPRPAPPEPVPVYRVGPGQPHERIMDAFGQYRADRDAGAGPDGVIEITGSDT